MARLLDSVAPEVNTISLGSALTKSAIWLRETSTASSATHPNLCERDAGLPNTPSVVKQSAILAATRGSTGVVEE